MYVVCKDTGSCEKNKRGKIQIQEAEITYIAVAALDETEIKKDVEGNVVYNVITFVLFGFRK